MIHLYTAEEIRKIREAGRIVAHVHKVLSELIEPGITTRELDQVAEREIRSLGALPSFLGYNGYPASICTSINEEVVHGIPSERVLREGDILSIDVGAYYDGFHGDGAWTYAVGRASPEDQKLLDVAREALFRGIDAARPGNHLSDISHAIQTYVEAHGFSVVRAYVGHGVGRNLHEEPPVPNFGPPGRGPKLRAGMVLAIEPMVNAGTFEVRTLDDRWTVVTADGRRSAHFEHTIAITEEGPIVLTRLD
ncbi:MAG: type I methionyl aminopeptidase [Brockia lithotrophica]|nr:type I methionyl aminopeptidase [Brockia lithotrophica]